MYMKAFIDLEQYLLVCVCVYVWINSCPLSCIRIVPVHVGHTCTYMYTKQCTYMYMLIIKSLGTGAGSTTGKMPQPT